MKPFSHAHLSSPESQVVDYELFKHGCLLEFKQALQGPHYKDYPSQRLSLPEVSVSFTDTLPAGPWQHHNTPLPTADEKFTLRARGYDIDAVGRPKHPWLNDMLVDPDIGVVTGKGFYWQWGPNPTVDPIIIRHDLSEPHVLLIRRKDTGDWALPGGFQDPDETALEGAIREAWEEAGINLHMLHGQVRQVYQGPIADLRTTAHAWPETTAFRIDLRLDNKPDKGFLKDMIRERHWRRVARSIGEIAFKDQASRIPWEGGDDADKAKWMPVSKLDSQLFGSHRLLIKLALQLESNPS